MSYLVNEVLLRLVKPAITLIIAIALFLIATGPLGEPAGVVLALVCWIAAAAFVLLAETGVI